eukprot:CAMPEP_0197186994 /NCGR_PEP_ID=MMETSP1423-20130617/15038_1 /TAXON_ID=476441 /ORGANISM="Pseudo-nitzschia heimii, Strain UNC1101" /LENGTH=39 /DNA_ID= /DNA_START= /DNA_END= /DNA_ORIENTATION=
MTTSIEDDVGNERRPTTTTSGHTAESNDEVKQKYRNEES